MLYKTVTSQKDGLREIGSTTTPWLQLLYIYYLAWRDNPHGIISVHHLKKNYMKEIKAFGFDERHSEYIGVQSANLYKYGYLSKLKATDGSNWNQFRIRKKGLDRLEYCGIVPPGEKEKILPITEFFHRRLFQLKAPVQATKKSAPWLD